MIGCLYAEEVLIAHTPKELFLKLNDKAKTTCILPPNKTLRIGCTKRCNNYYISALKEVARDLSYTIKIISLNSKKLNYVQLPLEIDAILSPGGHDIAPKYYIKNVTNKKRKIIEKQFKKYGKSNKRGYARDKFEFELFQEYFKNEEYSEIPILGICYGMQMLAAVKGLPLYVDIPTNLKISARRKIKDSIHLSKKSVLMPYLKKQQFKGYKNHHQAIDLKYYNSNKVSFPNTLITATSNQGRIAEIIEFENRPAIGVQFHPERSDKIAKYAIFKKFLSDACRKVTSK